MSPRPPGRFARRDDVVAESARTPGWPPAEARQARIHIWGQLSDRYAETAANYHRTTGNKAQVWALVYGADLNRVFFHYECSKLATLRFWGHVTVQCSKVADASWQRPADWCDCSLTCTPCPSP